MQYEEFLEFVRSRRTIRKIKPDPLHGDVVAKLLEAARWAPTGFNMQPAELVVVGDVGLRTRIMEIMDDWVENEFFALEATREAWQGAPWTAETHKRPDCPPAPVYILITGDTRRLAGLPMNARHEKHKADSIFESSLSNVFVCLWLAAHSLGLAAQPVSFVKNGYVQGLVKHLLNLPDFLYVFEMLAVGYSAAEDGPPAKLTRHLDSMVHRDRAQDDEFMSDEDVRREIRKLRAGTVARHMGTGGLHDSERV